MHVIRSDAVGAPVVEAPIFRGIVRVSELVADAQTSQLRVLLVRFDVGSTNVPHAHISTRCCTSSKARALSRTTQRNSAFAPVMWP